MSQYRLGVVTNVTLKAPITTNGVCFVVWLNVLQASYANSVDPHQTAPVGTV